jgi:sigma-B regulation protein RsbU (phosphoserine phosphatase)
MGNDKRPEFSDLNQRLNNLASLLEDTARRAATGKRVQHGTRVFEEAFKSVGHLFTHGVTGEGIRNLLRREMRDTLQFYTSRIDFAALRTLPPFKRYPRAAWEVFSATAYRLSPPRRVAFAIATFAFLVGVIEFLATIGAPEGQWSGIFWWLISGSIFVLLLLMELRDKLDLKGDLEIAREIQLTLVPSGAYRKNSISIYSQMRTANTVGGDYDDIIELGDARIVIVMGDVAGKGMPAALLMALLQGSLRTLITAGLRGQELMRRLNEYLCDNIPSDKLVTLFYGELDTATGNLKYVNAGHNAPFLVRAAQPIERLTSTGIVLGVLRDAAFESGEASLAPGERLLLFTDGLSEAFNPRDEEYGEERLADFLRKNAALSQDELVVRMIRDVLTYCDSARPSDDMTIMSVERLGPGSGSN